MHVVNNRLDPIIQRWRDGTRNNAEFLQHFPATEYIHACSLAFQIFNALVQISSCNLKWTVTTTYCRVKKSILFDGSFPTESHRLAAIRL